MKKNSICVLVAVLLLISCKGLQVAVPASLSDNSDKYHVKGASTSIFAHTIKIEGFGEAELYNGFDLSNGTARRLYPLYFDIDSRLNYISSHFQNIVSTSKTRYHFDFESQGIYVNTYCVARSVESDLAIKDAGFNLNLGEEYRFEGLIFTSKDTTPWTLSFTSSRSLEDGIGNNMKNARQPHGKLTHNADTIQVNLIDIKTTQNGTTTRRMPFEMAAGYEFRLNDTLLAFVDIVDKNIWVSKSLDARTRAVLVSAATSILIKTNV